MTPVRRPLALVLAAALAWSPAAPAVPAFAQVVQGAAGVTGGVRTGPAVAPTPILQGGGPATRINLTGPSLLDPLVLPAPQMGPAAAAPSLGLGASAVTGGPLAGTLAPGTPAARPGATAAPGRLAAPSVRGWVPAAPGPGPSAPVAGGFAAPGGGRDRGEAGAMEVLEQARPGLDPSADSPRFWNAYWTRSRATGGDEAAPRTAAWTDPSESYRPSGLQRPDPSVERAPEAARPPAPPTLVRMHGAAPLAAAPWLYEASPYAAAAAILAGTWAAAKVAKAAAGKVLGKASAGVRDAVQKLAGLATWAGGVVLAGRTAGLDLPTVTKTLAETAKIPWVAAALPYAGAVLTLAATRYAARLARKAADRWTESKKLPPGKRLLARHAATFATWGLGSFAATQVAGFEPLTFFTSLGIGTLMLSLSFKPFIANVIQGVFLMLDHPFDIGDKIRIDKVDYVVHGINLEEVELTRDGGETITTIPHEDLAGTAITIFKRYESRRSFVSLDRDDLRRLRPSAKGLPGIGRMLGFAALGLGVALPGYFFVHPFLVSALPWLYAAGIGVATYFAIQRVPPLIERWMGGRDQDRNKATLARMAASATLFLIGLAAALRVLNVGWEVLGASAVGTGALVTVAATSIIQSFISFVRILAKQRFTLGSRIEAGDQKGEVVDITHRYVVIKLDEPGDVYTLLPVTSFNKKYTAPGDRKDTQLKLPL